VVNKYFKVNKRCVLKNIQSFYIKIFIVGIILIIVACQVTPKSKKYFNERLLGISFVAANERVTVEDIEPIKELGATWVSLMPYGFVRKTEHIVHYNSPRQWWGESDEGLVETANLAKRMGLKIMVKPQVWFRHGEYTGAYIPPDSARNEFKESFAEFVIHYAGVAQKIDAELYCIGTEWHQFIDSDPEFWLDLIMKVRDVYSGKLTYAANWDEYTTVPFWQEMDYIGVNAYFPILDKNFPKMEELSDGWQKWSEELASMAYSQSKPIIFTEYGYRSIVGNTVRPWESYTKPEVSLENQKLAYQALYEEFWEKPWFAGGFAWKWFHNHEQRGGEDNLGFTPQNKPVESVIRSMYRSSGK
jgi:sugar phosphate isomerase/epimerase